MPWKNPGSCTSQEHKLASSCTSSFAKTPFRLSDHVHELTVSVSIAEIFTQTASSATPLDGHSNSRAEGHDY